MRPSRSLVLAALSVPVVVGVALWGYSIAPDRIGRWLALAVIPPTLWAFCEATHAGDRRPERVAMLDWHRRCIAWNGLACLLGTGTRLALAQGLLDPAWEPTLRRAWWIGLGVSAMLWGNYLPKLLSPWSVEDEPFDWQRVHRFVGRVVMAGGAALVLVWLTQTREAAMAPTKAIVGTMFTLALGRKLVSLATPRPRPPTSQPGPARLANPIG